MWHMKSALLVLLMAIAGSSGELVGPVDFDNVVFDGAIEFLGSNGDGPGHDGGLTWKYGVDGNPADDFAAIVWVVKWAFLSMAGNDYMYPGNGGGESFGDLSSCALENSNTRVTCDGTTSIQASGGEPEIVITKLVVTALDGAEFTGNEPIALDVLSNPTFSINFQLLADDGTPAKDFYDNSDTLPNAEDYRESISAGFMYELRHHCSDFMDDEGSVYGLCTAFCTQCSDGNRFLRRGLKNDNRCQVLLNNYQKMVDKFESGAPETPPC